MKTALVFPGQGAQRVGMMQDLLAEAPLLAQRLEEAAEISGLDLPKLVKEGPQEELSRTSRAQPVLFALCAGLFEVACEARPSLPEEVAFCAGHSLGEYTALFAAGVFDFATGVKLVSERGRLMENAEVAGGMTAVLGLDGEQVEQICKEVSTDEAYCVPANLNAPGQVVISGALSALEAAEARLKEAGARRTVRLQVSGPFHSPYMEPVKRAFAKVLEQVEFRPARFPVVANVTAEALVAPEDLRTELLEQLTSGVQWVKSVQSMISAGVNDFLELGAKGLLGAMIKRLERGANCRSVYDSKSLAELKEG